MPSLKLCHRRWSFASDDLLIPACLLIFLHFLSLTCLFVVAVLHFFIDTIDYDCLQQHDLTNSTNTNVANFCPSYIYTLLISVCTVIILGAFLLEIAVAYYSSRGTIMNAAPREKVVAFLCTRYVFISAEICFIAFTYVWFYNCPCVRNTAISALILVMAVVENVIVVLLPLFAFCSYDLSGAKWYSYQKAVGAATAAATANPINRTCSNLPVPGERARISHTKRRLVVARQAKEEYAQSWFKQFNCMFCCLGSERRAQQTTFLEVANLFGELFGDTDLVGTDLIAGLVLLRHAQKHVIRQSTTKRLKMLSGVPVSFLCDDDSDEHVAENHSRPISTMLDPKRSEVDAQLILRIVRIFKFAHSATGWPFYSMQHPSFLITGPLSSCHCCRGGDGSLLPTNDNVVILHDNLCKLNTQAVLRQSGLSKHDLLYADFEAAIGETAFIVMLDAKLKAVIVSARGTLSLSDVLTDLNADSAKIPLVNAETEENDTWVAHKGMLTAAIALRDRLIDDKILEKAFAEADRLYGGEEKKSGFSLILVGHSLGAGVATLIGILLKPLYSDLHVFAFSPPGGLLGSAAARYTRSFVTSVILGKDVVPRIGIRQIEALRADIVNVLKACNKPKWSVIGNAAISCCFHHHQSGSNNKTLGGKNDSSYLDFTTIKSMRHSFAIDTVDDDNNDASQCATPDVESDDFFQPSETSQIRTKMGIRIHHHPLQLPGCIHHIVRQWKAPSTDDDDSHQNKGRVELKIVKTCRNVYDHVLVSPRMLADHMPNGFMEALETIVKQHKLDLNNVTPLPTQKQ